MFDRSRGLTKVALYLDYLKKQGYAPKVDDDGDVVFKREGFTYVLFAEEEDEEFFRLALPNIWSLDDRQEQAQALLVATELNRKWKVGKVLLIQDNIWMVVEMFVDPIENFSRVFERSINLIPAMAREFRDLMKQSFSI